MEIFALSYTMEISTGNSELIGIYSTKEKAEEAKRLDMCNSKHIVRYEWHYDIKSIKLDETINHTYRRW